MWHTTGSGKTLTSFKTAQLASNMDGVDRVLFVVDRKDLDYQTIKEYERFKKGAVNSNKSTKVLAEQLANLDAKIIVTTIQKLSSFIRSNPKHAHLRRERENRRFPQSAHHRTGVRRLPALIHGGGRDQGRQRAAVPYRIRGHGAP